MFKYLLLAAAFAVPTTAFAEGKVKMKADDIKRQATISSQGDAAGDHGTLVIFFTLLTFVVAGASGGARGAAATATRF